MEFLKDVMLLLFSWPMLFFSAIGLVLLLAVVILGLAMIG